MCILGRQVSFRPGFGHRREGAMIQSTDSLPTPDGPLTARTDPSPGDTPPADSYVLRSYADLKPEAQPDWLWQGYLRPGAVTLLTSLWKSGKSTLLSVLLSR